MELFKTSGNVGSDNTIFWWERFGFFKRLSKGEWFEIS